MKKICRIFLLVAVSVFVLFYVGKLFGVGTIIKNIGNTRVEEETVLNQATAVFGGVQETTDTPWNVNAGSILMEDETTCLFLTPNTSVEVDLEESLCFSYKIHHWVNMHSDGAGLVIWLLDENNMILYEEEISVSSEADWKKYKLNLKNYSGAKKAKIICNNGSADNDSCDWVIIK